MKFRALSTAVAASALAFAPLAANAASADRASAPVGEESELAGGSGIILAVVAAAFVIAIAVGSDEAPPPISA